MTWMMGFGHVMLGAGGCFCVFCGVCVGCSWGRQFELHWAEFFEGGFNFPASYCFCRICILLKVSV